MFRKRQIMTVLGLLVMCSFASAFEVNDPIAHWKFDDGNGTIASDSAGGNDGTVYGANWTTGRFDGALSFDGINDYVAIPSFTVSTNNGTIALWFKTSADFTANYGSYGYLISQNSQYVGYLTLQGDGISPYGIDGETNSQDDYFVTAQYAASAGVWNHVVVSFDNKTAKTYLNGVLIHTEPVTNSSLTLTRIGGRPSEFFNGIIDDVRIYDRALSAEEVQMLYQPEPNEPELVGLEITGPNEVPENSQTQYKAIAHYDDSSTKDVTASAQWFVEPNTVASIDANGLLSTDTIFKPQDITIFAQYTEDDNTVGAEESVAVLAICPKGSALSFDGVNDYDYVDCGNNASLNMGTSQWTAAAWFKISDRTRYKGILGKWDGGGSNDNYRITVYDASTAGGAPDKVSFIIYDGGSRYWATSTTTVTNGAWHHVAGVRDSTRIRIYVDGVEEANKLLPSSANISNSVNLVIGKGATTASSSNFNGIIDDVRIYNRALSAEEILANMHTTPSAVEPNLVSYWNFDEGLGQIAHDISVGGNNGYLGSDPCNPDGSDPVWVDSDAPLGICSIRELIERNISDAVEIKLNAIDEIEQAQYPPPPQR